MIMDARIAAELLYESEATLRMVDTALDELRVGDEDELRRPSARMETLGSDFAETDEYEVPSEFCVRAYWQVQEIAECVRDSRELLQSVKPEAELEVEVGE